MVRKHKAKILMAVSGMVLFLIIFGQLFSNSLIINGKISSESGLTSGASMAIFIDDKLDKNIKINSNGKFSLPLQFNHEYTLVFSREDCFSKKIVVSTIVPENILKKDPVFPDYEIEQSLFSEIKGIDKTFSENTIEKIYYNAQVDNFVSKVFYDDNQIKKQIEEAILKAEQLSKAGVKINKQESEELKLLRKEYERFLSEAGDYYNAGEYPKALSGYMAANKLFPQEQFPIDRINEINDLLAALRFSEGQQPLANYASAIAEADKYYDELLWAESKEKYQQALKIKPGDQYAASQIRKIEINVADIKIEAKQYERYRNAIIDGNKFKSRKQFLRAEASYNFALTFKPGDAIALSKLEEVRLLLGGSDEDREYNNYIVEADELFAAEDFKKSLRNYEQASAIKPAEPYPLQRIGEIKAILSGEKTAAQIAQEYADKIKTADDAFQAQRYEPAKALYGEALNLKPDEQYPVGRIREIDQILADLNAERKNNEQYNALIAQADQQFGQKNYQGAKENYISALKLKSEEQYPQDRIIEINRLMAGLAQALSAYNNAIARADEHFRNKNYDNALTVYASAKELKPDETYPDEMIARIQSIIEEEARVAANAKAAEEAQLIAEQRQKDRAYQELIQQGDNLFNGKEYVQAIGKYRSALDFKPGEPYPIQKIEEIRGFISQMAAAQQAYDEAIQRADRNYGRQIYDAARQGYTEAKRAKPGETYPDEMLAKIDSTEQALAEQLARDAAAEAERQRLEQERVEQAYSAAITQGDASFAGKDYQGAISFYKEALDVKPEESYPKNKITEIEGLVAELARVQRLYDEAIQRADRNYQRNIYDAARQGYTEAKRAKPGETYPDEMLAKIDSTERALAEQLARDAAAEAERQRLEQERVDQAYQSAISQGDASFAGKDYQGAISSYKEALDVKPEESYPQTRITEIEGLVAELARVQRLYDEAIQRADRNYQRNIYDAARQGYTEAKSAKPGETYPDEMLAKIDSTERALAEQLARDAAAEAERQRLEQERVEQAYSVAITQGDASFAGKDYQGAIFSYKEALDVKPDESYPQNKITEIEGLVAELARAQRLYDEAIQRADRNYGRQIYDAARQGYTEAKRAKPGEAYPDEMLAKIDSTEQALAEQLARDAAAEAERQRLEQERVDQAYSAAIAQGDASFAGKDYQGAISFYKEALDVKPTENYPKNKITEIEGLVAELARAQRLYDEAIARADRNYGRQIYDAARQGYTEAKRAKPGETYPDEMLAKIDSTEQALAEQLARDAAAEAERQRLEQERVDQAYSAAIAQGDASFAGKDYQGAISFYKEALDVKPTENYPKNKITEIEGLVAELARAQRLYDEAIARADRNYGRQIYDAARQGYTEAKRAKPGETYPDEMLAKIDSTEQAQAEQLARDAAAEAERQRLEQERVDQAYSAAIAQGDASFAGEDYQGAISSYKEALDVKPNEVYPKSQLAEINKIIDALAALDAQYKQLISEADNAFARKVYEEAKVKYNEALAIKSGEDYPRNQLARIEQVLASLAEAQELAARYNEAIQLGDHEFSSKKYNEAILAYETALGLKPNENYPKERIRQANNLLLEITKEQERQRGVERAYQNALALADQAFVNKNYSLAEADYKEALNIKPEEGYPASQLEKIKEQIASEKASQYQKLIAEADLNFNGQKYEQARQQYKNALIVVADDVYASNRIVEIDRILQELADADAEAKRIQQEYMQAITQGDAAYQAGQYSQALPFYQQASSSKPNESYPKYRITEITEILRDQRVDNDYRNILLAADEYFKLKQYNESRAEYIKALNLKPEEDYPADQIRKIDDLLREIERTRLIAEQQAAESIAKTAVEPATTREIITQQGQFDNYLWNQMMNAYNGFLNQADEAFSSGEYNISRFYYHQALSVFPDEVYPKNRISEIRNIINARLSDRLEREFQQSIDDGDAALSEGKLTIARFHYNKALALKPRERYPRLQIDEIRNRLDQAQSQRTNEEYQNFISQADAAYNASNYSVARYYYTKASYLKPDDSYPVRQLQNIERVLNKSSQNRGPQDPE